MTADEVFAAPKTLYEATGWTFERDKTATKQLWAAMQRRIDALDDRIDEIRKKVEAPQHDA
ncbi:MAG: hypothetical protein QOD51_2249 [Candidatus Eremiobacteraeota bacterium]|nr:hypothetical protein [Candidatus Eremiobacteraeota bacterium]